MLPHDLFPDIELLTKMFPTILDLKNTNKKGKKFKIHLKNANKKQKKIFKNLKRQNEIIISKENGLS